jgi:hypothetical protein
MVRSTAYEADGQTAEIAYPNGVTTSFLHDPHRRWLDRITTTGPNGGILQRLIYDRSPTGRIGSVLSNRAKESLDLHL